jgi:hypothetical protein
MPFDSSEFHIPLQRLLLGLIIILAPITIFGLYIGLQASRQVQQMNGTYFRTIARGTAAITSQFIGESVGEVVQIANEPNVQQAVTAANRDYENVSEAAILTRADQLESKWNSAESDPLLKKILGSEVAQSIRRHRELDAKLLRILIIDQAGAVVAATDKPLHYFQTDTEYWRALSTQGQVKVFASEVHYDEQSRTQYISISAPVFQEGSGRFIGAVTALVDVSPLFTYINQQQIARTGRVFLIKEDGTVIAAPGVTPTDRVKSEEYAAIHDALGTLHGRETGYLDATLPNGEAYLIGFTDTGLKAAYTNLPWIVVVSQETREAEGPVRNLVFFAMLITVVSLVILSVLGAYVFLHRKQRFQDIEEVKTEEERETEQKRAAAS